MKTTIKIAVVAMMGMSLGVNAQKVISLEGENDPNFVNKGGKIGLGLINPSFNLDVSSSRANIRLRNTNPSNWSFLRIQGSGTKLWDIAQYGDNDFLEFRPNAQSSNRIVFNQNGKIGLGLTNPSFNLDVSSSRANIRLRNTNPSNWSFLRIQGSGTKLWDIAQYGDNDFLEFRPNAQSSNRIVFNQNGKIGLGLTNPSFNLDVSSSRANIRLRNTNPSNWSFLRIQGSGTKLWDIAQYGDNDFLEFRPNGTTATVIFRQNGNTAFKGKLEAEEIKVTTSPSADFVFEEDYNLPTLKSIENYIKEKKHLPEIASAKEMEKNGVNVGNFQIQLLQKIEELTLYTIDQQKEIEELKKQNSEIKELKALVQKLLKDKN